MQGQTVRIGVVDIARDCDYATTRMDRRSVLGACGALARNVGLAFVVAVVGWMLVPGGALAGSALRWGPPVEVDAGAPFGHPHEISSVSCPSASLCVGVADDSVVTSSRPDMAGSWVKGRVDPHQVLAVVSCPSTSLCVALDLGGNVATSTDPGAGADSWRVANVAGSTPALGGCPFAFLCVAQLTCPSVSLCVAVNNDGTAVVSSDPAAGAGAWRAAQIDAGRPLSAIACPSAALCAGVDRLGNVVSSTDPTGGAGAWSVSPVTPGAALNAITCPSVSLCVAFGDGEVAVSTDPAGGPSTWNVEAVDPAGMSGQMPLVGECPSVALCLAFDGDGNVIATTDPTAGVSAWTLTAIDSHPLVTVSCPSAAACVAFDTAGNVVSSSDPAGGQGAWSAPSPVDAQLCHPGGAQAQVCGPLDPSLECPTASLCVMTDLKGNVFATDTPTGAASSWRNEFAVGANALISMSCPAPALCVALDDAGRIVLSRDPTARHPDWRAYTAGIEAAQITCPSTTRCFAFAAPTHGFASVFAIKLRPGHTPTSRRSIVPHLYGANEFACPSLRVCVGTVGFLGEVVSSTDPGAGARAWKQTVIDAGGYPDAISCPSPSLCVAVDGNGNVLSSTHLTGGARTWKIRQRIDRTRGRGTELNDMLLQVTCPSVKLCVALDYAGNLFSSTDPTSRTHRWKEIHPPDGSELGQITCASTTLCVALAPTGETLSTSDPTGPRRAWTITTVDAQSYLTSLACPTATTCITGDYDGRVMSGTARRPPCETMRSARPRRNDQFAVTRLIHRLTHVEA
jgi:hypothetical protein